LTSLPTYAPARPTETGSLRKSVLIAQILVTLTTNQTIKDEDIQIPPDLTKANSDATSTGGHRVGGRTVALHSLAVVPEFQKAKVGSTLLRTFIQMIQDSKVVDRISLITYENLVSFYEKFGFSCLGKSESRYGGRDWYDMVSFSRMPSILC
jgi:ribosomal protein S18 acetylase RimI-like enzyme